MVTKGLLYMHYVFICIQLCYVVFLSTCYGFNSGVEKWPAVASGWHLMDNRRNLPLPPSPGDQEIYAKDFLKP